jgi:hypothetical protein
LEIDLGKWLLLNRLNSDYNVTDIEVPGMAFLLPNTQFVSIVFTPRVERVAEHMLRTGLLYYSAEETLFLIHFLVGILLRWPRLATMAGLWHILAAMFSADRQH